VEIIPGRVNVSISSHPSLKLATFTSAIELIVRKDYVLATIDKSLAGYLKIPVNTLKYSVNNGGVFVSASTKVYVKDFYLANGKYFLIVKK
jgi:hypothetical protein